MQIARFGESCVHSPSELAPLENVSDSGARHSESGGNFVGSNHRARSGIGSGHTVPFLRT